MGLAGGNASRAAELAGYAAPRQAGSRLLTNRDIREAVDARVEDDPTIATREDLQRFWTDTMLGMAGQQPRDQLKASELLAKSQAVFIERHRHEGPNGGPIETSLAVRFIKSKKAKK